MPMRRRPPGGLGDPRSVGDGPFCNRPLYVKGFECQSFAWMLTAGLDPKLTSRYSALPSSRPQGVDMAVRRIITNIGVERIDAARTFYGDILGMTVVTDHGWIVTFAADASAPAQISIATEGGSGTPVPDLSIEVDDLDQMHRGVLEAGFAVEYGPTVEPWGVRRFFVRDPFGRLVNILAHG